MVRTMLKLAAHGFESLTVQATQNGD